MTITTPPALFLALLALLIQGDGQATTLHVGCVASGPACGAALQAAVEAAPPGTIITLDAGKVYEAALVIAPPTKVGGARPLTITTRGWRDKGPGWEGLVTPADKPHMAILRGAARYSAAVEIPNGPHAGHVTLLGLAFEATPPAGQGEMIRIGTSEDRSVKEVARDVTLRQLLLQGDREYGQKRGIAANGHNIEISQIWCEEMFVPGQDSQCIAGWSGSGRVGVRHSYLAAASENILIGGAPVGAAEMQPHEWIIEDVILHKPLRWKDDGRNRQVKNLLEFKFGRNITARRVLAVNNWRAGQDGRGLLITYTTNGRCPECGGLENVLVEDFVMLNTEGGISLQAHSWQPDSHSAGRLRDLTMRNLYVQLSQPGRALQISDVLGRHDIRLERSTFINHGSSWLTASFGRAWKDNETLVDGGPMQGLTILSNVFTANGEYGVTAPEGQHFGSGLQAFVDVDLQIAGNVIGDAPPNHLANYNRVAANAEKNVSASREQMLKKLTANACAEWAPGKGADCTRLQAIFDLRRRLPEP